MSGCEKYQELISAMLDGELSEAEAADVQAHIASCDECRAMYEAFAAVSAAVSDGADMPDSLHAGIMSRVNAAAKATKKQGKLVRFQRTMAVAACFVVVVGTFFVLKKNLFNGAHETEAMDASAPMMMAAPAAGAATEAYCITEETAEEKCIAVEDEVVNAMEAPAEAAELGGIEMKSAAAPVPMPEPEEQADTAAAADEQSMIVEIRERMQNDAFIVVNAETDEVFDLHLSEDTEMTDEVRKALTPGCVVAVEYHTREQDERPVIYADAVFPNDHVLTVKATEFWDNSGFTAEVVDAAAVPCKVGDTVKVVIDERTGPIPFNIIPDVEYRIAVDGYEQTVKDGVSIYAAAIWLT